MKFELNDDNNKFSIEVNLTQIIKWLVIGLITIVGLHELEFGEFIIFVLFGGGGFALFEFFHKSLDD